MAKKPAGFRAFHKLAKKIVAVPKDKVDAALVTVAFAGSASGCFRWPIIIKGGGHGGGDAEMEGLAR